MPESPTVSNSSCLIALDAAGSLGILERLYRTIALSIERSAARLILDDKKSRRVARQLNLPVTGTLAVLLNAKERGIIPKVRDTLSNYPKTGWNPRKIQDLRAFSDSYLLIVARSIPVRSAIFVRLNPCRSRSRRRPAKAAINSGSPTGG
ncbi:MAG: DUF3368 domain-containing protein, partial [Isosphaeraceae bacterium]